MSSQPLSESKIQQSFVTLIREIVVNRFPELRWLHSIPNGLHLPNKVSAARAKREGLLAGIPDIFLPLPRDNYHGLYLEFKKGKNPQSEAQKRFQCYCVEQGYEYHVVRSVQTALQVTEAYCALPRPVRAGTA